MSKMRKLNIWFTTSIILLGIAGAATGKIIYVDADAPAGGDGTSWAKAYKYLQDALYKPPSSGDQIWVAAGTYKPDVDEGGNVTLNDRTATFQLISGVAIYGGFGGGESILSGDLNGDDGPNFANYSENSRHVVTGSGTDATAVLDGFVITAGYACPGWPDRGGGMYNYHGSPMVAHCTFRRNFAERMGGGMYNYDYSSPTLTNCTFSENWTDDMGGGIHNYRNSSASVTGCQFIGNSAKEGGGMTNQDNSNAAIVNCIFRKNSAVGGGGGFRDWFSSTSLTDCTFSENFAFGGGGVLCDAANTILTRCTFNMNTATGGGGGVNSKLGAAMLTDCIFTNNSAEDGGGMKHRRNTITLTNCTFSGNTALGDGGALNLGYETVSTLVNCTFSANKGGEGGGVYNHPDSAASLVNCILWDDSPDEISGGTPDITYSDVQGGTGQPWFGVGCIDTDPLFADSDGRLSVGSPCIDAGDNSAVPPGVVTDLDGNPRIINDIVDMGAFEAEAATPEAMLLILALFIEAQVASGRIDAELEGSLLAKINAAISALDRGNPNDAKVAMNNLKALINQVEAQTGKKITPEVAEAIITAANQIIAALGG